ncbi:EsaB/YukD family protein [Gulosibacter bifidus]|uniref:EsaB/YukD family protein n=1 Tax=Gulosibacter bifidus TaxID=272239 RepID=A0ABW5RJN1_9MICO|nr:EsaB/YukD family protein [Gulosibacter bifidus]
MALTDNAATSSTVPVTFAQDTTTFDLAVPLHLPLTEVVPAVIDEMGLLTPRAASGGFRLVNGLGEHVSLELTPAEAGIVAGDVLTVEGLGYGEDDMRYDDLVEALGAVVESSNVGWSGADSLRTCIAAACTLFAVTAGVLWFEGGLLAISAGFGAALAAIIAAIVVLRLGQPTGAVLTHGIGALLAAAGSAALVDGTGPKLLLAGVAFVVVAGLGFITLRAANGGQMLPHISAMFGLIYIGLALLWAGIARHYLVQEPHFIAVVIVTITALVLIMAPWIALAQTPIRSYIPRNEDERARDNAVYTDSEVRRYTAVGRALAVTIKIAGGLVLLFTTPFLVTESIPSLVLAGAVGASMLLATRQVRDRAEVLIGVMTGAGVLLEIAVFTMLGQPHLATIVAWVIIGLASLVLFFGALARAFSPAMNRWADALSVCCLLAIVPAAALASGLL